MLDHWVSGRGPCRASKPVACTGFRLRYSQTSYDEGRCSVASVLTSRLLAESALWQYLVQLSRGHVVWLNADDSAPWFEPGLICEVSEQTYFDFLELLPPRWMYGSVFAFGESARPFRLFWWRKDRFFVRELTTDETRRFCQLSGTSLDL